MQTERKQTIIAQLTEELKSFKDKDVIKAVMFGYNGKQVTFEMDIGELRDRIKKRRLDPGLLIYTQVQMKIGKIKSYKIFKKNGK